MAARVATEDARVTIVIVNWNTRERLRACLESVRRWAADTAVVVVDNASADGSAAMVEESFPQVALLRNTANEGFSRAVNQGARASAGEYLLLLNSDARLTEGVVDALVATADGEPRSAVVGAALVDPGGSPGGAAARFPNLWSHLLTVSGVGRRCRGPWYPNLDPRRLRQARRVDWVGGACMLVRRSAFDEIGGMDGGYFLYAEELDLCYRLVQRGWQVWHQPSARAIHEGGGSGAPFGYRSGEILYASQMRFFDLHYGAVTAAMLKLETYAAIVAQQWWRALCRVVSRGRYSGRGLSLRRVAALRRGRPS